MRFFSTTPLKTHTYFIYDFVITYKNHVCFKAFKKTEHNAKTIKNGTEYIMIFALDVGRGLTGFARLVHFLVYVCIFLSPLFLVYALYQMLHLLTISGKIWLAALCLFSLGGTIFTFFKKKTWMIRIGALVFCTLVFAFAIPVAHKALLAQEAQEERTDLLIRTLHNNDINSVLYIYPPEIREWHDSLELFSGGSPPREGKNIGIKVDKNTKDPTPRWYTVAPADAMIRYEELAKKHGDWLMFKRKCVYSGPKDKSKIYRNATCKSWEKIQSTYNIDVPARIKAVTGDLETCGVKGKLCTTLQEQIGLEVPKTSAAKIK